MANQADVRKIDNAIDKKNQEQTGTTDRKYDATFDADKYNVKDMTYPSDLFSNDERYGSNYVVFYINVTDAQRPVDAYGNALSNQDYVPDFDKRVTSTIQESNYNYSEALAGTVAAGSTIGAGMGAIGAAFRGNIGGAVKGALVGGVVAAAPVALLAGTGVKMTRGRKRLKRAIMMHMPNQLASNYNMSYGENSLQAFATGAELASMGIDAALGAGQSLSDDSASGAGTLDRLKNAVKAGSNATNGIGGVALSVALSGPATNGLQALAGVANNPKQEVLFNGVQFRQFQFQYQLYARNANEQDNVEEIIREFKYHMHPEYLDEKKFVYVYPSEFDISFYHADAENEHLPKIASCVLQGMDVNYTPNGVWMANKNGGSPYVTITLHFKELAILTKEAIMKGY